MEGLIILLVLLGLPAAIWFLIIRGAIVSAGRATSRASVRKLETKALTDAIGTLNNRLATGEITQDQYLPIP